MSSLLLDQPAATRLPLDPNLYGRLLAETQPAVVETQEQNERMLAQIEHLMDKGEARTAEEDRLLRLLARLVEDFEDAAFALPESRPHELLAYLLEQRGMHASDLVGVLGCASPVVADLIAGRQPISPDRARVLAMFFGVSADLFA